MKTAEAKTVLVFWRRGKESINPAVILSDILLLCSLWPEGLALMSLSHSEPRIKVCVRVCVCVCIFVQGPKACPREHRGARGHFNEQFSMERGGNGIGLELSNTASSGSD